MKRLTGNHLYMESLLLGSLSFIVSQTITLAEPIVPATDGTGTQVEINGNEFNITGGQVSGDRANLFHSFQEFGLNSGQIATFQSNPEIINILSRVTGGNASMINGLIQVTGGNANLFLMNPAGIVFGPNATLNIPADFIATTASGIGFNQGWFDAFGNNNWADLIGSPSVFRFDGNGAIVNFSNLNISHSHQLGLLGSSVLNLGNISAPGGNIIITAVPGESLVKLSQPGHLLSLEIDPNSLDTITPSNLPELLTGGQVHDATQVVVHDDGTIQLTGSGVSVPTDTGVTIVSGNIDVSNNAAGTVAVLGERVALVDANINASGNNTGGNVFIGGNFQGQGTLPNAAHTFVNNNSSISVNALENGNAGSAIVWADKTTRFHGNISATGGNFGGNGGFVEVSGKQNLIFRGFVDVTANQGTPGTILFDPKNIIIDNGGTDNVDLNNAFKENPTADVTFDADNITGLSGDVILEANNDITVNEPIILNSFSFIENLELRAGGSININAHITTYTTGANIILSGNDNRADVNNRDPGPANISAIAGLNGGNIDITLGTLGESGNITLATVSTQQGKHINITNTNNGYGGDIEISEPMSSSSGSNGGLINLIADGNILTNNINSVGQEGRGGNINLISNNRAIETGDLDASGLSDGGAIALNAEENILTNNINSFGQEGRGGNINFTSNNGAIETGDLNSSGLFDGGAIALNAEGNIVAGGVDSYGIPIPGNIYSGSYDSGTGGSINLHSASGFINTNDGYLNSIANQENGGDITLTAQGNINTGYISSYSQEATAGTIKLTSNNAAIETGDIDSASNQGNGNSITLNAEGNILTNFIYSFGAEGRGGNIHLTSNNGAIETGDLNSSGLFDGGAIALNAEENIVLAGLDQNENLIPGNGNISSDSAGSGTGGDISLRSNSGVINLGSIDASSNQGNGGDITLTAEGNINTGYISSYSQEATAGTINVTSNNAAIETGELNSSSNQGNGNSITLNADDDILITSNIYSDSAGSGTGGDISLTSDNGAINIIEGNIESSSNEGDGGNIELTAKGDIRTNNIDSYSNGSGTAGNIKLTSTSGLIDILGSLTSASLNGIGGSIALTADEIDWTEAIFTSNGGILLLQPATNTQSIEIGGNNESPSLDLSTTELQLIDGFDSLTIGRTGDTGIINIAGLVNFSNDNFDLTISGGSLSFNNRITIRNNGILTLNTGSITSPFDGTDIAIGGNGTLVLNVSGNVGELLNPLVTKVSQLDIDNVTGNVFLNNITDQNFNLGTTNITGDFAITNDGNIIDIGAINISGNSSFTTTGNDATITLDQLSITGPVSLNTTGSNAHVNITNATGLNLADSQVGGNLNIATTTGNITDSGTVMVNGNSNFTTLENGAGINLDQLAATGAITVNTNGVGADVIITNDTAVNLGNSNIGGSLNATANNSDIITSGNINAESDINLTGQAIALNNSITSGGNLTATASGNISNSGEINAESDINLSGNNITLNNSMTSGGSLNATANNGEISNSGEINAGNDITLTGDTISLKNSLTSPGNLILQPFNPNTTIDIGGETGTFNLSAAEIANLSDGFSSITIGRSDGTGMVNLGNISFSDPVTIRSPNGAIAVNGIITGTDNASVNLSSNHITLNSGIITNNQNILINGNTILGNDITLDSGTGLGNILFTGTIDGNQKLTLNAGNGTIAFTGAIGNNTTLNSLITNSIINSGLQATANTIQLNRDITTTGANVILNAQNQLTTNNITTNGGKISLSNRQGDITAGNLDSSNPEAVGGAITVNSPTGIVTTGNLISTGTTGGDITAIAKTTITTGDINSSGIVGNAGNVLLDPENDIQVGFINAQGGSSGSGGNVDISTGRFFRSTNSFTDQNGQIASISTAGGNGGGSITIRHDGGSQNIPFVVGDPSTNGTAGVITTSADNTIPLGSILPGPVEQGDIHIQTPTVPVAPAPVDDTPVSPQLEPEPQAKPIPVAPAPVDDTPVSPQLDSEPPPSPPAPPVNSSSSVVTPATVVTPPATVVTPPATVVTPPATVVTPPATVVTPPATVVTTPPPPPKVAILDPKIVDPEEAAIAIDIPNNSEEEEDLLDPEKISQPDKVAILDPGMGAIEQAFSQRFNDYIGEVNSPATTTLAEAQNIIQQIESETGVKPALVYVCFGFTSRSGISDNDPLELILVTANGHPIKKSLSATRGEVIATANNFIDYITSPRYRRQKKYLPAGQQLYQWLIAPLKEELDLQQIENIAFIMDQGLRALPVAAIHDGEHFLVEKYSLGLMPSLSLTDTRYQNIQNASVLGMGYSEFSDLNSLPAVPAELQTITQQIRHGDSFMNQEFTLNNIQAQYADKQYPIVHMATHGEFEPGEISNSYIQLWDQKLHLDDIRQLGFTNPPVELLVLSACRTAVGSPEAELGFAGLALQAGVKTAIASLWYVSDEGTFGLMTEFYNQLSSAPIKAEAMRQAQLSMINGNVEVVDGQLRGSRDTYPLPEALQNAENQKLTHPYYWSAFTLIGSPW
ncbi:CHAT domain-containing protein [Planktothricoides raciborskii]|uniref:CHAT domain-containing protein n=1 Tax=Planktothricoides raciborskii TaxID=132608 RepID=UPI00168782C4|nr:CHAT domain-containing protein [Planktothricoides raciborskii]